MFIMKCTCSKTTIGPNEECLSCLHKHLSIAFALAPFDNEKHSLIEIKIASQIYLAMLHSGSNEQQRNSCISIIQKISNSDMSYKEDLKFLLDDVWISIPPTHIDNIDIVSISKSTSFDGALFFSNAIELVFYESPHERENASFAVGQLSLAEWKLPKFAKQIREMRHKLVQGEASLEQMHNLRKMIWTYCCSEKDK